LLLPQTSNRDPLAAALRRKVQTGAPGAADGRTLAAGEGWRVIDIVCTSGPRDRAFEEQHSWASISLVLRGTFVYRSRRESALMSPGAMLLGSPGYEFVCSHQHGEGDRCVSFQYDPDLFDRFARDMGTPRFTFAGAYLPPLRAFAPLTARAATAMERSDSFEEIALELAGAVIQTTSPAPRNAPASPREPGAIARVLRQLESRIAEPIELGEMARLAGFSRFHFLRTFRSATGVTPHQWLLRARLRDAARRLATSRDPVTEIALDVGFEDLSNFIRSFRGEFGVSPRVYRANA
jgi:AraC family transcriptional regulator